MQPTRVRQYDAFTGEELDGSLVYIPPKRKNGFTEGWIAMSQKNTFETLARGDFGVHVYRVWAALMLNTGYENIVQRSQRQIALDIGMAPQHFNKAVNQLCDEGIFLKRKVDAKVELRLNPEYGWKGSAKNHVVALADVRKQRKAEEPA